MAELPTICAYEDTHEEAREIVLDAIQGFKEIADEEGSEFPEPFPSISNEYSGRITLRLPRSHHEKVFHLSSLEGVSINQYLVSVISSRMSSVIKNLTSPLSFFCHGLANT